MSHKLAFLKQKIQGYGSCLVAFSGGQDSAFLLKVCSTLLPKKKLLAVTAVSPTYPESELLKAKKLASLLGVRLKVIKTDELSDKNFALNSPTRCYYCKKELFGKLKRIAKEEKLNFVLDASNTTDKSDYRPGSIAKKELKVKSPLQEAGISKEDIRLFSKKLGLITWNKPALACLASRIPYNTRITGKILKQIDRAENYLLSLGFEQVRLRHHDRLCRIEVGNKDLHKLVKQRENIVKQLKCLGYNYVSLDLQGYRTGSMNEVIK